MTERIEGVPTGTKLVRIGQIKNVGEWAIGPQGRLFAGMDGDYHHPVIVPDNVYGVIDLPTVPIPEGWERDGETVDTAFRNVDPSDNNSFYLDVSGVVFPSRQWANGLGNMRCIHVRRIKPKTRRVLVCHAEIPIKENGFFDSDASLPSECNEDYAQRWAERNPSVYGIEERPL